MDPGPGWYFGEKEIDGNIYCEKIKKIDGEFLCYAGAEIPMCCLQDSHNRKGHPDCCIEFEEYYKEKG